MGRGGLAVECGVPIMELVPAPLAAKTSKNKNKKTRC